jgi:hypothetical protein
MGLKSVPNLAEIPLTSNYRCSPHAAALTLFTTSKNIQVVMSLLAHCTPLQRNSQVVMSLTLFTTSKNIQVLMSWNMEWVRLLRRLIASAPGGLYMVR